ncbi:MAG: hypothetical protein FWG77_08410 [Treponema sp.]|nr:hypothetical protein [Treponema sp.]
MEPLISTLVFDLDGTLYQHMSYHRDYMAALLEGSTCVQYTEKIVNLLDAVLCGDVLKMNAYYRVSEQDFTDIDSFINHLKAGYLGSDDGLFEEAKIDKSIRYLGDPWFLCSYFASALGIKYEYNNDSFLKTREKMLKEGLSGSQRLLDLVKSLREGYEVFLLSNSEEMTAASFIRALGYEGVFTGVSYGSRKPFGFMESLERICPGVSQRPQTILSIGDHAYNDLEPVRRAGGKTLWVDPYNSKHPYPHGEMVSGSEDLAEYLEQNFLR